MYLVTHSCTLKSVTSYLNGSLWNWVETFFSRSTSSKNFCTKIAQSQHGSCRLRWLAQFRSEKDLNCSTRTGPSSSWRSWPSPTRSPLNCGRRKIPSRIGAVKNLQRHFTNLLKICVPWFTDNSVPENTDLLFSTLVLSYLFSFVNFCKFTFLQVWIKEYFRY